MIDLINAEITLYDQMGNVLTGGAVSSYTGGAEENDSLKPEKRTKTLEQLSKQNRLRQGKIVVQAPDGEYESPFEKDAMSFVNYDTLSVLTSFDIGGDTISRIQAADLSEVALQKTAVRFKCLLEEGCLDYQAR